MMADTLKGLRKALEDLTHAYKRILGIGTKITDYQKLEEIDSKVKAKEPILKVEDFITGDVSFSKKNITPTSIANSVGTSKTSQPFIINAKKLGLFKNGEKYALEANFVVKSAVLPSFVQIIMKNEATGTLLEKSRETPPTARIVELEFVYKASSDDEILFLFDLDGNLDYEVEWSRITFYKMEAEYTEEQKSAGAGLLELHVNAKKPYFNVIRNSRGAISVPLANEEYDAVPLKHLKNEVLTINKNVEYGWTCLEDDLEAVRTALNNEKEERKSEDEKRYTKKDVDEIIENLDIELTYYQDPGTKALLALGASLLKGSTELSKHAILVPIYSNINAKIDEAKAKIAQLETKAGVSPSDVESKIKQARIDILREVFQNGYLQLPGMQPPEKVFKDIGANSDSMVIPTGYIWRKRDDVFISYASHSFKGIQATIWILEYNKLDMGGLIPKT